MGWIFLSMNYSKKVSHQIVPPTLSKKKSPLKFKRDWLRANLT